MHFYTPRQQSVILLPGTYRVKAGHFPSLTPGEFFFRLNVTFFLRIFMILSLRFILSLSSLLKPIIGALLNSRYFVWLYFVISFKGELFYVIQKSPQGRRLSCVACPMNQFPRNKVFTAKGFNKARVLFGLLHPQYIDYIHWRKSQLVNKRN